MAVDTISELTWDIDPLVEGRGEEGVEAYLDRALEIAGRLHEQRGKVGGFDAAKLVDFMTSYGEIMELGGRASSFARLAFTADTQDPKRGALVQKVEERMTEVTTLLLFFDLEWTALGDAEAEALLEDPRLGFAAHYLSVLRRSRKHLLSEPEERILAEKAVTGRSAWSRLFNDLTSRIEVDLDGPKTLQEALSRLSSSDREERRVAGGAVTRALEPGLQTRAYIH
ncbi:MAG: oligoendopeptidase, partial [Actinomycetota bacterium]|nr:oligoendopeptidase [Actinomycetota bacterium]